MSCTYGRDTFESWGKRRKRREVQLPANVIDTGVDALMRLSHEIVVLDLGDEQTNPFDFDTPSTYRNGNAINYTLHQFWLMQTILYSFRYRLQSFSHGLEQWSQLCHYHGNGGLLGSVVRHGTSRSLFLADHSILRNCRLSLPSKICRSSQNYPTARTYSWSQL